MGKINADIDMALSVLCIVMLPGETLSTREIAYVCGCAKNSIYEIEKRALKKIKPKLVGWR